MKVKYKHLTNYAIDKLIIVSLEQALYQALVVINNEEHIVWDTESTLVQTRTLNAMKERFETLAIPEAVLRQESPYDEMVGQATKYHSNRLEVPLGMSANPITNKLH
ncbi:MAG: DUF6482 family protein [Gammaproteobacteria bacterium]|jgi:hypothetical protein